MSWSVILRTGWRRKTWDASLSSNGTAGKSSAWWHGAISCGSAPMWFARNANAAGCCVLTARSRSARPPLFQSLTRQVKPLARSVAGRNLLQPDRSVAFGDAAQPKPKPVFRQASRAARPVLMPVQNPVRHERHLVDIEGFLKNLDTGLGDTFRNRFLRIAGHQQD